jgi:hypothetical protein
MNLACHFFHIYQLFFHLKKRYCLQTLRRFYGVTRYLLVELIFFETQDDLCILWELGVWILTTWPSHSYTLAYCRPIHLISIEFQNIDNNLGTLPKKLFLLHCYDLAIHGATLIEIFSTNCWDSNVQDIIVGIRKKPFNFDLYPPCK